jgi:chorismate mutase
VTYNTETNDLRRQIDKLDHEIIDKIVELSKLINCYKHKNNQNTGYKNSLDFDIKNLARQKNLDEKSVSKIFKEILQLIEDKRVNQD